MRIVLVTPAPPGSRKGNRVTAERWAGFLAEMGHEVAVLTEWNGTPCDLLVGLHARKSHPSIRRFRAARADLPLVVALTGTDVYRDLPESAEARESIALADRLVGLQRKVAEALAPGHRSKLRVIYQSVSGAPAAVSVGESESFDVCVLAHLRAVKDPLRAAAASRLVSPHSRLRVAHAGAPLDPELAAAALAEQQENPRYRWLGEIPREEALALLARSRLLVLTSHLEGGANVVSEALAVGVPVLSSRVAGSEGMLGEEYPGFFPVGDERALAELLRRAESDAGFYGELTNWCRGLRGLVLPERERDAWRSLLAELARA